MAKMQFWSHFNGPGTNFHYPKRAIEAFLSKFWKLKVKRSKFKSTKCSNIGIMQFGGQSKFWPCISSPKRLYSAKCEVQKSRDKIKTTYVTKWSKCQITCSQIIQGRLNGVLRLLTFVVIFCITDIFNFCTGLLLQL